MDRYFNTEGICLPEKHYMVRLDTRVQQIKERLIERGSYFVINRGRQYGKTTTLRALEDYLREDYLVLSMDFQGIGTEEFLDSSVFSRAFLKLAIQALKREREENSGEPEEIIQNALKEDSVHTLSELFVLLSKICGISKKPIILLIDEVDSASNNQVFLDFLAMLRDYYLHRDYKPTFHSVIFAGVYDIKNLKLKIRPESEHKYNSPWNIAAKFSVKMSFSTKQIASMLLEYEQDHHTGMDIDAISECIFDYTSGYPYLVSAICKIIDEELVFMEAFPNKRTAWTRVGIEEAVKLLMAERIPLFDSMTRELDLYGDMRNVLEDIIYRGQNVPFSMQVKSINLGLMFGYLKDENGRVAISNRIFEMVILNLFIAEEATKSQTYRYGDSSRYQFIESGKLNMELVLQKFIEHFHDIYGDNDDKFIEQYGRKFFLLYLKPIINGTGNYYIEAQTRDARRMDVVVDYLGEQFIVELKIWHGNEYNERGEQQLVDYLDYYHKSKGYMLSFNFNKKKETGMKEIKVGDRTIVEAVV